MFEGLKNSFKSTVGTGKRASNEIIEMAKEVTKAPWKKLTPLQWGYIIVSAIIFLVFAFVIFPILN